MTLKQLSAQLTQYEEHEAQSIMRLVLNDCFGITFNDICGGALDNMSDANQTRLSSIIQRIKQGEPVQYVIGHTRFYNRNFIVTSDVLIPRPETEGLIVVIKQLIHAKSPTILDIGTGSGCIAITIAKEIPSSHVTAWDISEGALSVARRNAEIHNADVTFTKQDALNPPCDNKKYDIIVSNPPYICTHEAQDMDANVLEHEPHIALFVPDDDPLLYYRSIAIYASRALNRNGILAIEINPLYCSELSDMLLSHTFCDILVIKDDFGKNRIIRAKKS